MTDPIAASRAKQRFFIISLLRLSGAALFGFGLITLAGNTFVPKEFGYPLVLVGMADFILVPYLLAKKWKTPAP
ncbi:MAG: hypothetical protein J0M19_10990 [Sphingomonadales bacterium]|nr:hypothetical protein [Sphingomonadales bacterium]